MINLIRRDLSVTCRGLKVRKTERIFCAGVLGHVSSPDRCASSPWTDAGDADADGRGQAGIHGMDLIYSVDF